MSSDTRLDGGFDFQLRDRDDDNSLILRGVTWALPIGISFWLIVAALFWMG